jgi:hypothetical protein
MERRTWPAPIVLVLGACVLAARPARPDELAARVVPATAGFTIHDASETLRDWCHTDAAGVTWLVLPGGVSFELISSPLDPAISNHGDGRFHPFDAAQVGAALEGVRYPLDGVAAEVFILPMPRRAGLTSVAGPGLVLLSPGVYELTAGQQHREFVHELGHLVQYTRLPDSDTEGWARYRALRGIENLSVYRADAPHPDRPHEIFAEDFRALFGDPLAVISGGIENSSLTAPAQVPGLSQYLLGLTGSPVQVALSVTPNPARGPVVFFARAGAEPVELELFDVSGRRIARLAPETYGVWTRWSWDGRGASGERPGPGIVFARTRDGRGVTRVTLLP